MGRKRRGRREEEEKEVPLPGGDLMLGVIEQFLGYDRARVRCADGKTRLCRIPGKYKKRMWMKVGDIVLVAPWDFQADKRGDIVYRYTDTELQRLIRAGLLQGVEELLESAE